MFIKAIHSSEQEVGRNIRRQSITIVSTKKKFTWKFSLDNIDQEITLYVSSLSGKKKITLNGRTIHEESNLFGDFRFVYRVEQCNVTICPAYSSFDLYLDNIPFAQCYKSSNKNNKHTQPLTKNDDDGYDLSPIPEPPKTQPQIQPALKLKVQPEQKQQEWWAKRPNDDFGNFGTPSTNGTDNIFGNFGFNFETPTKNQGTKQEIPKFNPFLEQPAQKPQQVEQSFWPLQQQTKQPILSSPQQLPKPSPQIQQPTSQFFQPVPQIAPINYQIQPIQHQPQQFQTQPVIQKPVVTNLLDLLDEPSTIVPQQQTQNPIYNTHSCVNYQQPYVTTNTYQKQTSSSVLPQQNYSQPQYRTAVSLPNTTKKMTKELEDMFDEPQVYQIPIQRRPTPFDDDLFD